MEFLGYSEDFSGLLELALRIPYQALIKAANGVQISERPPHPVDPSGNSSLENGPDCLLLRRFPTGRRQWRLFRIRPANHLRRRKAGATVLLYRTATPGLLEPPTQWANGDSFKPLLQHLAVADPSGDLVLIGCSRALDITINVFWPLHTPILASSRIQSWQAKRYIHSVRRPSSSPTA